MSITSDEVNYLVYRYLLESGFIHSAFSFGHESLISKATIDGSKVSPGALISFVQKGLQFAEIEAHINNDGTETICNNSFSATQPHKCSARSKRRIFDPYAAEFEGGGFGELEAASADVMRLKGHSKIASACAWHPRRPILASGSGDATTRLWEFASGGSSDAKDSSGAAAAGPRATSTKILTIAESGAGSGSGGLGAAFVTLSTEQYSAGPGISGYQTWRVIATPSGSAANVYTVYGQAGAPMQLPSAYQVAAPFGADTGGTNPAFWAVSSEAQYDSWITVGLTNGDSSSSLASIGLDFNSWADSDYGYTCDDCAVFWMAPDSAPSGDTTLAQFTVRSGSTSQATFGLQGRSRGGAHDWQAHGMQVTIGR